MFQHILYIKFTASTLPVDLASIWLYDYLTCMPVDLGASRLLIVLFFSVVLLIAIGYDYSKQYVSACI